jgi:hypothetical protein
MKTTQHWRDRRREYLEGKGKRPAPVIDISQGFMRKSARVTADEILDGFRCTTKFLAEQIGKEKGGRGTGADPTTAPVQMEFPAGGAA